MGRVVAGVMGEGVRGVGGCSVELGVLAGGWSGRVGGSAVVVVGVGGGGSLVVFHSLPIVGDFGRL